MRLIALCPPTLGLGGVVDRTTFDVQVQKLAADVREICRGLKVRILFHRSFTVEKMASAIKRVVAGAQKSQLPREEVTERLKRIWDAISQDTEHDLVVVVSSPQISSQIAERYSAANGDMRSFTIPHGSAVVLSEREVQIIRSATIS